MTPSSKHFVNLTSRQTPKIIALVLVAGTILGLTFSQSSPSKSVESEKRAYWTKVSALGPVTHDMKRQNEAMEKYRAAKDARRYFHLLATTYHENGMSMVSYAAEMDAIPVPPVYKSLIPKYIAMLRAGGNQMEALVPLAKAQKERELSAAWAKIAKIRTDNAALLRQVTEEHKKYAPKK